MFKLTTWTDHRGAYMFNLDAYLGKWYVIPRLLNISLTDWLQLLVDNGAELKRIYRKNANNELMVISWWPKERKNKFDAFVKDINKRLKNVKIS